MKSRLYTEIQNEILEKASQTAWTEKRTDITEKEIIEILALIADPALNTEQTWEVYETACVLPYWKTTRVVANPDLTPTKQSQLRELMLKLYESATDELKANPDENIFGQGQGKR